MKIVSIVWYKVLPPVFGGQKGIAGFNQQLGKLVSLTCLCSKDNPPANELSYRLLPELPAHKWQFLQPSCWNKIRETISLEKATHLILEHPYHGIAAIRSRHRTGVKLIVHSHNIESRRFRELGKWWWPVLYQYEKRIHRKADLSLFKTEADFRWALQHFKLAENKCLLLPYGIDPQPFENIVNARVQLQQLYKISPDEKILLFAGTLDYEPNAEAVEVIYKEVVPRFNAKTFPFRILICGRNRKKAFQYLRAYQDSRVIMAGEVEDLNLYYEGADAFINPVQRGGGMQTKNIDALAQHLNVVCFEDMVDKQTRALAPDKLFTAAPGDWEGFTNQIIRASRQSAETPAVFFDFYSWQNIVKKLLTRLQED